MNKNIFYLVSLFTILLCQFNWAQTSLKGKIVDSKGDPIAYAHIHVENTNLGTISNYKGEFKLIVSSEQLANNIVISFLGYKTKSIQWSGEYNIITLIEDATQLNEVVVVSTDFAKELVVKAINAIPNNYPATNEKHTGFFRETTYLNANSEPAYIAEAVIEAIKEGYSKKRRSGDVKLIELRKYESTQIDSLPTRIYAGSHHIHRFDVVSRREGFMSNIKNYEFKLVDTLKLNDKDVFKVQFRKRNKYFGHVYIEDGSFAFAKAEINQDSNFDIPGEGRQYLKFTVSYQESEDGIWRFNTSKYKTAFKRGRRILHLESEYVSTDIKRSEETIPYLQRLQFLEILLDNTKEYNPDFWDNYNTIATDETSEAYFKSMQINQKQDEENQPKRFRDILKRFVFEFGFSWTNLDIGAHTISYTNDFLNIEENSNGSNKSAINLSLSILYELSPKLMIGYTRESHISKTGINSDNLMLASKFNINPNGRPMYLSPRLNIGFQQLNVFLDSYDLEDDLVIDGKKFNSETVDVFRSQRGFRLNPSLAFTVEQNKRITFFASVGLNFSFNEKYGLLFREKGGFNLTRNTVFLEEGMGNLGFESNRDSLIKNNLILGVGTIFKF
ncbi:carboxypeptidase-like regulatory domain-containing protein [Winogradskyella poriferorum]|uniref:carboxypeptidase-like regulatory domain-containing protein n=1 Tax=Winogradskyella poriferorum TaxID=307627 RepID=UPI003D658A89